MGSGLEQKLKLKLIDSIKRERERERPPCFLPLIRITILDKDKTTSDYFRDSIEITNYLFKFTSKKDPINNQLF